jgi:hypothetical protein
MLLRVVFECFLISNDCPRLHKAATAQHIFPSDYARVRQALAARSLI